MITTRLGAEVAAGQKLAQISDLHNRPLAEVRSPSNGLVGAMRIAGSVQAGELVFRIFRDIAFTI